MNLKNDCNSNIVSVKTMLPELNLPVAQVCMFAWLTFYAHL